MSGVPSFAIALYSQMAAAIVLAPALLHRAGRSF
jgi:hypothetical protein